MAFADFEIVEIVRRRDLDRAAALFRIGIFVGDDRDPAADQRQDEVLADEMREALVLGMDGNAGVAEHGFRPRRGDRDEGRRVGRIEGFAFNRIAEMPKVSVDLLLLDLEVGDRRQKLRIPVHKALVLVDQPLVIERDEDLEHRLGEALVHGEAFARPVARCAEPLQLIEDHAAGFGLPLPHLADEFLAADVAALDLPLHQLAFDDHLRGDAGMIHAWLPEHVLAAHALEADEDVLQRVVERMAHMQRAGDVRRRDDDGERLGVFRSTCAGAEGVGIFPHLGDPRLDRLCVVRLFKHEDCSAFTGLLRGW